MSRFLGHCFAHRRFRWRSASGRHHRALYARWLGDRWECCISGYGMRPYRFFAICQSGALLEARLRCNVWGPGWELETRAADLYAPWDGVPDRYPVFTSNVQLDLFPAVGVRAAKSPLSNTGLLGQFDPASFGLQTLSACAVEKIAQGRGVGLLGQFSGSKAGAAA